ncbi:RNA polymerase II transcription factor SIII subunit A-domain-containing protein [Thermothelomyces heterothallicus CBS 202.75]|uniref:RNA polymerase II transcription factor SIII subunit A-domain-containing protein n=1 Tax=Thermothelomyces heterothallicus CBS 202.75 TaxID=1149848 RepID=UPI003744ACBE
MTEPRAAAHVTNGFRPALETCLGPRSLADMCLRVALSNVRHIQSLGNLPPQYTGPILRHVKTAEQLHQLELNSDDIYDQTAAHWMRIIKDKFPELASEHNFVPQNRKSWHKVYDKYEKLQEEQIAAATEKLKQGLAAQTQQQQSRKSTIISSKESMGLRRPKAKPGYSLVPKKQDFFSKTRTQLRMEAGRFRTSPLASRTSQIKKAPAAMIEEARIKSQPSLVPPPPPPLRLGPPSKPTAVGSGVITSREEKEARLVQIKNAGRTKPEAGENVLRFSDDEDDEDTRLNEDDDLFGDFADPEFDDVSNGSQSQKAVASSASSPSRTASTKPLLVPEQPTKHLRDPVEVGDKQPVKRRRSVEEADAEQPTKRRRSHEEITTPMSSAFNKASTLPSLAPQQSAKRRPKGLSAAPGTNKGIAFKPASRAVTNPAIKTVPKPASKEGAESKPSSRPAVNPSTGSRSHRGVPMTAPSASRSRSASPSGDELTADHGRRATRCGSQDPVESLSGLPVRAMQPANRYPILRPSPKLKNS